MNTPMPPAPDIEAELRRALEADAERITPDPALPRILDRAHERSRPRTVWRRRWLPVLAGGVATAGIVAAAVVLFAPSDDPTRPAEPVPCAVEVRAGCPIDLAVYYTRTNLQTVVGVGTRVTSSGNVGLDAVQVLLDARSHRPAFVNPWHGYDAMGPDAGPVTEVNDVTHDGGVVTVDFARHPMSPLASVVQGDPSTGRLIVQQLVLTVQSALRTDDPIRLTVNGEVIDEAFGAPLPDPVAAEPFRIDGIRVEQPAQGAAVTSPVTISGEATSTEGNIIWQITRAGEVVEEGNRSVGSLGDYLPYSIRVQLEPGTYTLKLWEPNLASGPEAWADELSVVYVDFAVE